MSHAKYKITKKEYDGTINALSFKPDYSFISKKKLSKKNYITPSCFEPYAANSVVRNKNGDAHYNIMSIINNFIDMIGKGL